MRRLTGVAFMLAAVAPLASLQPASAHAAWQIAGFQYLIAGADGAGSGGYLSTPAGAIPLADGFTDDGIGSIANRDPVNHSFTECTGGCDTAAPSSAGARFDIALPASSSASSNDIDALNALFEGHEDEWIIFCRFHPTSMRARLRTTGA